LVVSSRFSIRWWLGGLVAAVALPLLLLASLLYVAQAQREQRAARLSALRIAKAVAARMARFHAASESLLSRVTGSPALQQVDAHSCDSLFALIDFFPQYANLFLFDPHGNLICSAQPQAADRNLSIVASRWVARELHDGRLRPGMASVVPVDSRWVSVITAPVRSPHGELTGTLVLLELPEIIGDEVLPSGAVVTILDEKGTIIARTTDPVRWTGQNHSGGGLAKLALKEKEGVAEEKGVDGVSRQYGFTYDAHAGWYVYAGLPTAAVMAPVQRTFVQGAVGGLAIIAMVLVVATLLSRAIQRPIRSLATATESLARGGYWKVNVSDAPLEIAQLAETFNEMVERREAAQQQMQSGEQKLKALSDRLLVVQEEERTRIARELHDDLGQSLTALKMDILGLIEKPPARGATSPLTSRIVLTLDAMVTSVQRISTELRPSVLDDLGLIAAIESEAQLFEERTGIEVELSLQAGPRIDNARATVIYRIVQEALTNVARHSDASRVELRLRQRPSELLLEVRDDGRGVTAEEVSDPHSLGVIGIRERAALVGGTVHFEGVPGRGTIVSVRIPSEIAANA
jgi:signal transduction histidine kinase